MILIESFTLEELQAAANVECEMPVLKTAFIFSALSGLRWSDIEKLVCQKCNTPSSPGVLHPFQAEETKGAETLPISEQAFSLLGGKEKAGW